MEPTSRFLLTLTRFLLTFFVGSSWRSGAGESAVSGPRTSHFTELGRKYGPTVKLQLGGKIGRVAAYGGFDITWTPYGPEWRMLRKVCTIMMLSNASLDSVYELRRREVRNTVGVPTGGGGGQRGRARFFDGFQRDYEHLEKMIDERLRMMDEEESRNKNDFLQFLLKVKDESDSKTPLTMVQLKALLTDMIIGGTDTSSNTIEFAMAEMMKNPKVAKKAMEELVAVVGEQNMVEESHIQSLPYLKAVMKETLRLHPILQLLVPHCPSQTTVISNYTIPKGSRVFVNVWAIHRDPNYWENPLEFDGKFDFSGSDFRYIPFVSGRRNCAGIAMAERTVMYLPSTLLHSFDWKLKRNLGLF
ncbi:unnamed protein product [Citrullus colocynthis]|uniref:Cytochrome P450 n=1 Tax=Citrullus colocynthis TaxID=252529 RepID=A0ABP0XWZ5_9ROSI